MSSAELNKYDNLIYFQSRLQSRDLLDHSLEHVLSRLARIETKGTEVNIPLEGNLVVAFLPHSGFLESVLIDKVLSMAGRNPAVWVTKKESRDLPSFLQSDRRFIYIDRENPEPSTIKAISRVLNTTSGTIGSALEGTRFSNPDNEDDVLTLGETLPGLMRFAFEHRSPVLGVVVLGVDKILPLLDKTIKEKGSTEALRLFVKSLVNPKEVQLRFLPLYQEHLIEDEFSLKGKEKNNFIKRHNEKLTGQLIEGILTIDPKYPLGFYKPRF